MRYYYIEYAGWGASEKSWYEYPQQDGKLIDFESALIEAISFIDSAWWSKNSRFRIVEVITEHYYDSNGDLVSSEKKYFYIYLDEYQNDS